MPVLDVRQANELAAGPIVVMCGRSERAMGAASLLARAGRSDISVLDGGTLEVGG